MRADREALIETTDYGRVAVFHLVIPAYYPLVMDHPIAFADELLPLVITGGRHRGTDLVWFALRRYHNEERLYLNFIGLLPHRGGTPAIVGGLVGFFGSLVCAIGCVVASAVFPPCALAVGPVLASGVASWTVGAAGIVYEVVTQESIPKSRGSYFLGVSVL
ncbi:hypothetical protein FOFC_08162 [Fusarium oxysporum]|nr:hypothetical protein FOFC_08162 [Fusarium oxysporum]